jgi:hypothetical protein
MFGMFGYVKCFWKPSAIRDSSRLDVSRNMFRIRCHVNHVGGRVRLAMLRLDARMLGGVLALSVIGDSIKSGFRRAGRRVHTRGSRSVVSAIKSMRSID